jgi:NAD(P)-dependent dehydrogenase (short-subunit alcohol dehydrogenase family)
MVIETQSPIAQLLAKYPVLLAWVVNDLQLALIHPPGNGDQQKAEWVENSLGFQSPLSRGRSYVEQSQTHTDPVFGPYGIETGDRLPQVFATNVLAPYILTVLMMRPERLTYLSSGLHRSTTARLDDVFWRKRSWDGTEAYSETKLYDTMLAFAIARRWPDVFSNALEPGWVPTKMGGADAPDDINQAHLTQVWLAVGDDARVTGQYFYHRQRLAPNPQAEDTNLQDRLISVCEKSTQLALAK